MSMRLAQLHDKMAAGREMPKHAPTPSPRSPNNSTDGLLPSVCEIREVRKLFQVLNFDIISFKVCIFCEHVTCICVQRGQAISYIISTYYRRCLPTMHMNM